MVSRRGGRLWFKSRRDESFNVNSLVSREEHSIQRKDCGRVAHNVHIKRQHCRAVDRSDCWIVSRDKRLSVGLPLRLQGLRE